MPNIRVKRGVSELRIPAKELLMWVCANGNKKEGKPVPVIPTSSNTLMRSQGILRHWYHTKGKQNRAEMLKRRLPTCIGV